MTRFHDAFQSANRILPMTIFQCACFRPRAAADALRKLGIWEKTARQPANSQLEQLAPDYPLAAQIVEYRRERKRYRELEAICSAEKNGRVYPSFSQMRTPHGCLSSDAPRLDEAIAAGAVLDEELLDLFGNANAGLESLRDATGDSALRADLSKRRDGGDFIPGPWAATGVPQGEILLAIVSGESDHAICGRFLIKKEHAAAIRNRLVLRYRTVFAWLDEFRFFGNLLVVFHWRFGGVGCQIAGVYQRFSG